MTAIELELRRANLAREILTTSDESTVNRIWLLLKGHSPVVLQQKKIKKREIGFLDGVAKIEFRDDFKMTTDELLLMQ